jgi:hypothetical protein
VNLFCDRRIPRSALFTLLTGFAGTDQVIAYDVGFSNSLARSIDLLLHSPRANSISEKKNHFLMTITSDVCKVFRCSSVRNERTMGPHRVETDSTKGEHDPILIKRAKQIMSDGSPLHILAICSRPLIDLGGQPIALLDVAQERRRIEIGLERAGNMARVHFLPEATTGEVQSALRDVWNVVHFTGHGTVDGSLLLEDGLGVAHMLTKREMAQLFAGRHTQLVVLSACFSETVGRELHAAGVPAVVAVYARVPIADRAAIIFAAHFYAGLSRGWDVQRAFDDAQRAIALDPEVGDSKPPQDARGNNEEPWSRRFELISAVQSGAAAESAGTPWQLNW